MSGATSSHVGNSSEGTPPSAHQISASVVQSNSVKTGLSMASSDSPALNAVDELSPPKLSLNAINGKIVAAADRTPPVPSDFPGKKRDRSAHMVNKGDFESDNHFYARCCKSGANFPLLYHILFPRLWLTTFFLFSSSERTDSPFSISLPEYE